MKNTTAGVSAIPHKLSWAIRIGIFVVSFALTVSLLVFERHSGVNGNELIVGEPAPYTLFSPFEVTYINEEETSRLRQEVLETVPLVYRVDPKQVREFRGKMEEFFSVIEKGRSAADPKDFVKQEGLPVEVSGSAVEFFLENKNPAEVSESLEAVFQRTVERGLLTEEAKDKLQDAGFESVTVINSETGMDETLPLRRVLTVEDLPSQASRVTRNFAPKNRSLRYAIADLFGHIESANLDYDDSETRKRQRLAEESVAEIHEEIKKGELIVQRGMRVTVEEKMRLGAIQRQLSKQKVIQKLFAVGLLVFLTYALSFIYLYLFERKTLLSFRKILLIHSVFIVTLLLCKVIGQWSGSSPYLMPVAAAPLLLTILLNQRLGLWSVIVMAVLSAPLANFQTDVMTAALITSLAGILATVKLRKRLQFLKIGATVGFTYSLVLLIFQMLQGTSVNDVWMICLLGLANGFVITMPIVFIFLPLLESVFGFTSDITLLEISDLNHPLLKRMVVEAPGTYHHSLSVSTLAESACEAIGANSLLARVGCYFHDIGKIAESEYFTENQGQHTGNRHAKLTPQRSCEIILNHVKRGKELGRRYKLRDPILRFISEHQGTGVIYYFYRKAVDAAKPGEEVKADDYRYPGPKPQSKETAVALLADSTEAASRALKEPAPENIRQLVRKIINDKFIDGQLDECDLTLRDLYRIQESFIHNLMAIYHTRVPYPSKPESADTVDLFKPIAQTVHPGS